MKRCVVLFAMVMVIGLICATAEAQVIYGPAPYPVTTYYAPAPAYYGPAPVTTYYAPAPVTAYYAPAPVYYRGPAVLPPRYVYPGQPVRNFFRRPAVVW